MSIHDKSLITVTLGTLELNVTVEFTVDPGEPQSWDSPGCGPTLDCIDCVTVHEVEYPIGGDEYGYVSRDDRPDAFDVADRWVRAVIDRGDYDDDIMDNAEDSDTPYYASEDDYV